MSQEKLVLESHTTISVSQGQIASDFIDGEKVILSVPDGIYFSLNPVGARIWDIIQEPREIHQVVQTLLDEYEVDQDSCEKEVFTLLQELAKNNLLTIHEERIL